MVGHSNSLVSRHSFIGMLALSVLLLGFTSAQVPQSPNLVSNQALTDYLNTNVLPTVCVSSGFENALKDIGYLASLSYVIRNKVITNAQAKSESLDEFVTNALQAAVDTPNQVVARVLPADNWNDSNVIKNTQHFIYAVSDGSLISYYDLQFDLNFENAISDKNSYIGAMTFLACDNRRQWIQHYFAPAPAPSKF